MNLNSYGAVLFARRQIACDGGRHVHSGHAFTLPELLVVIAVIGILANI
jgi:prepilin-type N-terminal cleavage/methylation domain-containing protein